MALIEIKSRTTRTDRITFAVLWIGFFALLASAARGAHGVPTSAAALAGACFVISLAFNRDVPRARAWWGAMIPASLLAFSRLPPDADLHRIAAALLAGVGLAGGLLTLASPAIGHAIYTRWMLAVLPIGWTLGHAVLGVIFFGVVTPIGLCMRLAGRDPLDRRIDRAATTYWRDRRPTTDPARYLRQS